MIAAEAIVIRFCVFLSNRWLLLTVLTLFRKLKLCFELRWTLGFLVNSWLIWHTHHQLSSGVNYNYNGCVYHVSSWETWSPFTLFEKRTATSFPCEAPTVFGRLKYFTWPFIGMKRSRRGLHFLFLGELSLKA